ncbi:MAG TPA: acireductone synthase, partial [Blastocatellia bacterium]|nr:acireductone synthase [Blastocatellia bacterium]
FSRTRLGDLTGYISEYFDTNVGAKTEDRSYRKIAAQLRTDAHDIMFVSDLVLELNAARVAGMETVLCVRPGNRPQPVTPETANIETFDELFP